MNGAGSQKRRSARLSHEGTEENEPPAKRSRVNGAQATTVSTKERDGDSNAIAKARSQKSYDKEVDGFAFKKGGRKAKEPKQPAVRNSTTERQSPPPPLPAPAPATVAQPDPVPVPADDAAPKTAQKKARRRFPTTPEREAAEKPVRRSKRLSDEHVPSDPQHSPHRAAHAKSHANIERSPSPEKARPITIEKKRKRGANGGEEEEKIMRIALPFADTPVIRRNKEMRKGSADGSRRSSSGMRGRRASSLIDEGRGNEASDTSPTTLVRFNSYKQLAQSIFGTPTPLPSDSTSPVIPPNTIAYNFAQDAFADRTFPGVAMPHAEVPATEFYKHISADLTEPRRMRCLMGWCGSRALPPKPDPPKESTPASSLEFQALQAARVIQAELSQDLITKGMLSDWFSRDEAVPPQVPLKKKPNPRNVTNTSKAEELERELERLKKERAEWNELMQKAVPPSSPAKAGAEAEAQLSPLHPELLDSPERSILEQLQAPMADSSTDPGAIQQRLRNIAENLEFSVDLFAHGVHALATTRDTAERLADRSLAEAAGVLEEREKERRANGKPVDAMDALRALGKVMNARRR
ncbi:hypothetical protein LTR36_001664 [Oleoguttula mirabilis]|uniref:Uncharacterized protein n=1 Tax=Oleoguttula mirabilis TaxID=1507867 RepID=A0AAV9JN09_9PEZI|nr:hypothetical protein LTR36_001664 [Oleoguttula mirabilis]